MNFHVCKDDQTCNPIICTHKFNKEYELDEYLEIWTCSKIVLDKLPIVCSDTANISKTVNKVYWNHYIRSYMFIIANIVVINFYHYKKNESEFTYQ